MESLKAAIRFLPTEEGGRTNRAESGIRPQLMIGTQQTSATVNSTGGERYFESGVEYEVEIDLMFGDAYLDSLDFTQPVVLLEGSKVIAKGHWLEPSTISDSSL